MTNAFDSGSFIRNHWRGNYPFFRAFWINYLLVHVATLALSLFIVQATANASPRLAAVVQLVALVALTSCQAWAIKGAFSSTLRDAQITGLGKLLASTALSVHLLLLGGSLVMLHGNVAGLFAILSGTHPFYSHTVHVSADGQTVLLSGRMSKEAADALEWRLERTPTATTVELDSDGGWLDGAMRVRSVIGKRRLVTRVNDSCTATCVLPFLVGKERVLGPHGRVVFTSVPVGSLFTNGAGKKLFDAVLAQRNIEASFRERISNLEPNQWWAPAASELVAAGVATMVRE